MGFKEGQRRQQLSGPQRRVVAVGCAQAEGRECRVGGTCCAKDKQAWNAWYVQCYYYCWQAVPGDEGLWHGNRAVEAGDGLQLVVFPMTVPV